MKESGTKSKTLCKKNKSSEDGEEYSRPRPRPRPPFFAGHKYNIQI